MSQIRLSVIVSNFNHSAFLEKRISSILEQLADNDELLILDDASTDNSVQIVEEFMKRDARLRLIKHAKNMGPVHSSNIGVQEAKGIYLTILSADDHLLPGFVSETMKVLLSHKEMGLCCSDCALCYDGFDDIPVDKIFTTKLIGNVQKAVVFPASEIVKIFRSTTFWVPGHTSIMKKDLVLKYGPFQEDLGYLCDWFVMHSMALCEGVAYLPGTYSVWRQDAKSYSKKQLADPKVALRAQMNVFRLLSEKKNKHLRNLFRRSSLLRYYLRTHFGRLLLRPATWDFLFFWIYRALVNRAKKFLFRNTFERFGTKTNP